MPNRDVGTVVSILIGHPDVMSCELMANAFKRQSCFKVVARAATTVEVLDAIQSFEVDVALINVELQDGPLSGFVALRKMLESRPRIRPVMLLATPDPHLVVDSFRAGAKGVFCPSQSQFKTLCRCVTRVHAGQIWASSSDLAYVMEAFAQLSPLRILKADGMKLLAKREEDVVRLVADGFTNRDIACELKLSEHTVKNYLFHIFDKLGVSSRVELALCAVSRAKIAEGERAGETLQELVETSAR